MIIPFQYEMFESEEETHIREIQELRRYCLATHITCDKLRKAMWGRHGAMQKEIDELKEDMTILKKGIIQCSKIDIL